MNTGFQYLKIPYGENILTLLGGECMQAYEQNTERKPECKKHFHNLMEIAVCRMGSGEIIIDNKVVSYKENDVIVIPRDFSHAMIADMERKSFWEYIYVNPYAFLEKIYETEARKKIWLTEAVESRAFITSKQEEPALFTEINLIMDQCRRQGYEYRKSISGLLFTLFIEIARINHEEYEKPEFDRGLDPQNVEIIGAAMEYIEKNFAKDLRIADVAQAAFVSETCLRRLFVEYCQISPMHYAKTVKIEKACELLENKHININEVAYKVGYSNCSTFINNFKQITGQTPKQWRQNQKQKKH